MSVRLVHAVLCGSLLLTAGPAHAQSASASPTPTPVPGASEAPPPEATPAPEATPTATAEPVASPTATPAEPEEGDRTADEPILGPESEGPDPEEGSGVEGPTLSGWITTRYDIADGAGTYKSANTFSTQFARIELDGKAHKLLRYHASIELTDLIPTLGAQPRTVAALRDAYVVWDFSTFMRVKAGQFLRPAGYEARTDERNLMPLDRSLNAALLAGNDVRDLGVLFEAQAGPLDYSFGATNGLGGNRIDVDNGKDALGRVASFLDRDNYKLRVGATVISGEDRSRLFGVSEDFQQYVEIHEQRTYFTRTSYDVEARFGPYVFANETTFAKTTFVGDPQDILVPQVGRGTATSISTYAMAGYEAKGGAYTPYLRGDYRELSQGKDFKNPLGVPDWTSGATVGLNFRIVKRRALGRLAYTFRKGLVAGIENPSGVTTFEDKMHGVLTAALQVKF